MRTSLNRRIRSSQHEAERVQSQEIREDSSTVEGHLLFHGHEEAAKTT